MKKLTCLSFILIVSLMFPFNGNGGDSPQSKNSGRALHLKILSKYRNVDKFYQQPIIWGSLTNNPLCCINVPERDWRSLPDSKKNELTRYAASLVKRVKANPFNYSGVNQNAPTAPVVRKNVTTMTDNSWCIIVGHISKDGRDIIMDRIAIQGK